MIPINYTIAVNLCYKFSQFFRENLAKKLVVAFYHIWIEWMSLHSFRLATFSLHIKMITFQLFKVVVEKLLINQMLKWARNPQTG